LESPRFSSRKKGTGAACELAVSKEANGERSLCRKKKKKGGEVSGKARKRERKEVLLRKRENLERRWQRTHRKKTTYHF